MWPGHHGVQVLGGIARHRHMPVALGAQSGEHARAIGTDRCAGGDHLAGELDHVQAADLVGQFQSDPAEAAAAVPFHGDRDWGLVAGRPALARGAAAHEALVELHHATEQFAVGADHGPAQFVQPRPGGLIRAESQRVFQPLSGHPVLLRGDEPNRRKPRRQRRVRAVKDRASSRRGLPAALDAHPQSLAGAPTASAAAFRASESVRPAELPEIFAAGDVIGKPRLELLIGARVVDTADGLRAPWHTSEPTALKQRCRSCVRF